jgi:hypothetical protein
MSLQAHPCLRACAPRPHELSNGRDPNDVSVPLALDEHERSSARIASFCFHINASIVRGRGDHDVIAHALVQSANQVLEFVRTKRK